MMLILKTCTKMTVKDKHKARKMNVHEIVQFQRKYFRKFFDEPDIDGAAFCDDSEVYYRRVTCSDIGRVSDGWFQSTLVLINHTI
jgi:hypothetical protein